VKNERQEKKKKEKKRKEKKDRMSYQNGDHSEGEYGMGQLESLKTAFAKGLEVDCLSAGNFLIFLRRRTRLS
jgi:hypothetical protein